MSLRYVLLSLALLAPAPALAAAGDTAVGTWTNPKHSIEVRTRRCGSELCGTVTAASAKAKAKAQRAGVTSLVGTELFRDYQRNGNGWSGTLYVPDKGRTVSSRIQPNGPDQLSISGCLIGRILCKTQVWTRVGARSMAAR